MALILAIPAMAQFVQPLVIGGAQPHIVSTKITQVAFCSNNTCSFAPGTTNAIGQGVVTLSNGGMFSGTWTMPTTGTATNPPGASCPDNSAFFTISSAGVLTSTAQSAAQGYTVCVGASQAGLNAPNPYIQVVTLSPGVTCGIGPPYTGAIPAAASAASFTTCAANYDFTNTSSFTTNGHSYNFSTIGSWLDCAGSANPLWWRGSDGHSHIAPCGNATMTTDAADAGKQALQLTLSPSDVSGGSYVTAMETSQPGSGNGTITSANGTTFPQQYYIEGKWRMTTPDGNVSTTSTPMTDFWSISASAGGSYVEFDFIEMYASNSDIGGTNDLTQGFFPEVHHANATLNPGYDHTNYHVFGERITMNSAGSTSICFYVDGVQSTGSTSGSGWTKTGNCITGTWITPSNLNIRMGVILWNGNGNTALPLSAAITSNWEYIRVFSCPNWNTGGASGGYACASSPISSNP